MWRHLAILLLSSGLLFSAPSSAKESPSPTTSETSELPAKVREFVGLMDDPQVRAWLAKQIEVKPVPVAPSDKPDAELNAFVAHLDLIRAHFAALAQVIPTLPEQFEQAAKVAGGQIEQHSFRRALFLLALFVGLGFGVEWLFWRATTRFQARYAVSLYVEGGRNTFEAVHVEAAARVARLAREARVERLVHISGIGADPASSSSYIRARSRGEQAVQRAFPTAILIRPAVMFGPDDAFLATLVKLVRLLPVYPMFGRGHTKQPVGSSDPR
jgi:hypothetical protein